MKLPEIFQNAQMKKLVSQASTTFGVPERDVFLLKNYSNETDINSVIDILQANLLVKMLSACRDFFIDQVQDLEHDDTESVFARMSLRNDKRKQQY